MESSFELGILKKLLLPKSNFYIKKDVGRVIRRRKAISRRVGKVVIGMKKKSNLCSFYRIIELYIRIIENGFKLVSLKKAVATKK